MNLWQDVRFAFRLLAKQRLFTVAAAIALALGIGANATVFTLVNAVLLRGLPFDEPDSIVAIYTENARGGRGGASYEDFEDWRDSAKSFTHLVATLGSTVNVSDDIGVPERYAGSYVSWDFFRLLRVQPVLGRDFQQTDDQPGADPVVMIGHTLWRSRYGGDPQVLGRVIKVNSRSVTVVGVMPEGLEFPNNVDLWIPRIVLPPESFPGRGDRGFNVLGRLAPRVSLEQARAEMATIGERLAAEHPATNQGFRPGIITVNEQVNGGPIELLFLALQGAVAFVLLIACANVANLLLARSVTRSREIAVRVSLGATRWRIVRQLLVESLLLSCAGGAIGFLLALVGVRWFDLATQDVGKPYWMVFTIDPIVFAFVAAICVLTALLFGLAPALHVSKTDVNGVLKEGGRSGGGGLRARRWTGALVIAEVVLTIVLLAGAGFMMRSFFTLYRMDTGILTENLGTMRMYLPLTKYPQPGPRAELYQRFDDRLAATPSLRDSALTTSMPLSGGMGRGIALDGRMPAEGEQAPTVTVVAVSDRYFQTIGVRPLHGRGFDRRDGLPGSGAAIVNERFAAIHSSGQNPLGRQVRFVGGPEGEWLPIVGVVANVRQRSVTEEEPDPVVYVPLRSMPERTAMLLVRSPSELAMVASLAREELRVVEPDIPLFQVQTMDQVLAARRWPFVVFGSMFAVFAGIALILSAVGLYAVTAYSVTQRTQEIGVRMALGAQPREIRWLVLRRAMGQLAIGLPIGIAGAYGVGRVLQSVLVRVAPGDPLTLVGIVTLLVVVAVAACLWPARRAARLDPVVALHVE
jgi:predicted permease